MPRPKTDLTEERKVHRTCMHEWESRAGVLKIRGWTSNGLSYKNIAQKMGIAEVTLFKWRRKSPIIQEACTWGREKADLFVQNALFKRAIGYTTEEEQTVRNKEGKVVEHKTIRKEVPASTTAAIFWLCNRCPIAWKNQKYEHTDNQESLTKLDAVLNRIDDACKKSDGGGSNG